MTREDALLKLLQVEPATRSELLQVTGWDVDETNAVLDRLVDEGKVTYRNGGNGGCAGYRWYMPKH